MKNLINAFDQLRAEGYFGDYAIGGGIATLFYTEPFATIDVDVFATIPIRGGLVDLSPIYARLLELGFKSEGQYVLVGDQPVQVLVPPSDLEEEAVREAVWRDVEDVKVKVFRPEHLIAIYLRVGRAKDFSKIQALLEQAGIEQARLEAILQRYNLQDQWNRYPKKSS